MSNPFTNPPTKPATRDGLYDDSERGLANRNPGTLLETLTLALARALGVAFALGATYVGLCPAPPGGDKTFGSDETKDEVRDQIELYN